jgi:hypothetical protein
MIGSLVKDPPSHLLGIILGSRKDSDPVEWRVFWFQPAKGMKLSTYPYVSYRETDQVEVISEGG